MVTIRTAARGVGPGALVPQVAQTLYIPALVNGGASTVPGVVFSSSLLPSMVVCGIFAKPWLAPREKHTSSSMESGLEAPR